MMIWIDIFQKCNMICDALDLNLTRPEHLWNAEKQKMDRLE